MLKNLQLRPPAFHSSILTRSFFTSNKHALNLRIAPNALLISIQKASYMQRYGVQNFDESAVKSRISNDTYNTGKPMLFEYQGKYVAFSNVVDALKTSGSGATTPLTLATLYGLYYTWHMQPFSWFYFTVMGILSSLFTASSILGVTRKNIDIIEVAVLPNKTSLNIITSNGRSFKTPISSVKVINTPKATNAIYINIDPIKGAFLLRLTPDSYIDAELLYGVLDEKVERIESE